MAVALERLEVVAGAAHEGVELLLHHYKLEMVEMVFYLSLMVLEHTTPAVVEVVPIKPVQVLVVLAVEVVVQQHMEEIQHQHTLVGVAVPVVVLLV